MKEIRIEKITLNLGAGKNTDMLEKGMKLFRTLTEATPVKTITKKRIPSWGLRPGLPIGCKINLRGEKWNELLKRLLAAKDNKLTEDQIDKNGNISFGIHECIDIPGLKYDPEIGIIGFEVCVTLERPGFRVKRKKIRSSSIGKKHRITRQDAAEFLKKNFNTTVGEGEE